MLYKFYLYLRDEIVVEGGVFHTAVRDRNGSDSVNAEDFMNDGLNVM
jgi:hypothetical protein